MGDINRELQASMPYRLVGRDEVLAVDIVDEGDGINRIAVTSKTAPAPLGTTFITNVTNGGSADLTVNAAGTPQTFELSATTQDRLISVIRFYGRDTSFDFDDFLGQISPLTNGILVEIKTEDVITQFPLIRTSDDFRNKFSGTKGWYWNTTESPNTFTAEFIPRAPFFIRRQGFYTTDDYIRVIIQDNLTSTQYLECIVEGTLE